MPHECVTAAMWSLHWHCYGHTRCPRGVCFIIITVLVAITALVNFDDSPCVSHVGFEDCVCVRERDGFILLTISVQLYYNSKTTVRRCILYILYLPFKSLWMSHPLKNNPIHSLRWG